MKTLQLLRNDGLDLLQYRDIRNIKQITAVSLNSLYLAFAAKPEMEVVDDFLDLLSSKNPNRINALMVAYKYRDRRKLPTWGRRALETCRLSYSFISRFSASTLIPLSENDFHCIQECMRISFLLTKGDPSTTKNVTCNPGKYISLYRDYSILPIEILALSYLKNIKFQIVHKVEARDFIEIYPQILIGICDIPTPSSLEACLDKEDLAVLAQKVEIHLTQADDVASIARNTNSIAEFLLAAKCSHFLYQISLLLLKYLDTEYKSRGMEFPLDLQQEMSIAEENRAEIALLLKNDCRDLLLEPIVTPWGRAMSTIFSSTTAASVKNQEALDIRQSVKNGISRNPIYPLILAKEWPNVLDALDINTPVNFVGAGTASAEMLYTLLFREISKRFIHTFSDPQISFAVLVQMNKWKSAPVPLRELIFEHEAEHLQQNKHLEELLRDA